MNLIEKSCDVWHPGGGGVQGRLIHCKSLICIVLAYWADKKCQEIIYVVLEY